MFLNFEINEHVSIQPDILIIKHKIIVKNGEVDADGILACPDIRSNN